MICGKLVLIWPDEQIPDAKPSATVRMIVWQFALVAKG